MLHRNCSYRFTKHNYALACLLAAVIAFNSAPAQAFVPYKVKTIAVETARGVSEDHDSPARAKMWKRMVESKSLNPENVRTIAMSFLNSKLQGKISIVKSDLLSEDKHTIPQLSLVMRLDYSVWPHAVDGKTLLLGAIALTVQHSPEIENDYLSDTRYGWQPVEAFVVSDDDAETQTNLETAIARLLDRYSTIQKIQQ